ncbi:hypothetical protein [Bradyrhizobium sp. LMTR 3]|uniref:hypothetical protein n=1 Tax=Bradyrhizobium sp. LMTR 3 TaxID=189873 RepID=UPI000810D644|nr:hypothetical protein [Bradyrhizobium sp. LMTR 3]OCK53675.1 hypothetical protein LMTR3_28740 [Bradyrhizobium sp. LMTR 3]
MAAAVLVDADVSMGRELVRILDEASFPVTGAAWIFFPDVEEWRLVIRTPKAEKNLQQALLEIAVALDNRGDLRRRLDLSRVKLVPPADKMLAAMGSVVRADGISTIRFSRNVVNGVLIDDALIYRLAA